MNDNIETIGCDLGDKRTELCVLRTDGQVERPRSIRTTPDAVRKFFTRSRAHVVLEVGTHSRWVAQILADLGHRVTVANPRQLQLISQSVSKSDRSDAELLARLGRADIELLKPVEHRADDAHAGLAIVKARDALVRCRTKLVTMARSLVKPFGTRLPKCSAEAFRRKARGAVPSALKPALEPVFAALDSLHEQIALHERAIHELAKATPDVDVVSQPSGVGELTALAFILTVGDKTRFKKSRDVGAYFGLKPKRDQTGGSDPQLRITKAGNPFMRRLLVSCAHYILGPFGPESDLRAWGQRLAERGGKNAKKRAIVAVARKLAVLLHRLWVTGEVYDPLRSKGTAIAS